MSYFHAIILGIIQGATEFLPVSSSGHLALGQVILNLDTEVPLLFDTLLHFGTLIAIFAVYYRDIIQLIVEGLGIVKDFILNSISKVTGGETKKIITTPYRKFVMLVIVTSIPTGIIGILVKDIIEHFKTEMVVVGLALIITALLMFLSDKIESGNKREEETTYGDAVKLGLVQSFAMIPGISRSGSTIVGGLLCGLDREFVVKYSFIMSLPAILGATLFQLIEVANDTTTTYPWGPYIIGTIVAAGVGYVCIKTMLVLLKNSKLHYFGYYCATVGIIALISGVAAIL